MVSWMEPLKTKISSPRLNATLSVFVTEVVQISQIQRFHKSRNVGVAEDRKKKAFNLNIWYKRMKTCN